MIPVNDITVPTENPYNIQLQFNDYTNRRVIWETRTIIICDIIDADTALSVTHALHRLASYSKDPITLLITSTGGAIIYGNAIVDAIRDVRSRGIRVIGKVEGACMSMATGILQACDVRVATKTGIFMVHGMTAGQFGDIKSMEAQRKVVDMMLRSMLESFSTRTHRGEAFWGPIFRDETPQYYTAEEALELGLIDEIV